jgi:hypothetical protein
MKNTIVRTGAAVLAMNAMLAGAWAADCVAPADMAALETAALQQELMVAAFSCHDVGLYNHFVRSHQPELIASDARLEAYFVQRDGRAHGEASYHSYKTELANSSSLRSIRNTDRFCDRAGVEFDAADNHAVLSAAVDEQHSGIETTYRACRGDGAVLADASTEAPPPRTQLADNDTAPRDVRAAHDAASRHGRPTADRDASEASDVKYPAPHRHLEGDTL